jgi:hypothetical protein
MILPGIHSTRFICLELFDRDADASGGFGEPSLETVDDAAGAPAAQERPEGADLAILQDDGQAFLHSDDEGNIVSTQEIHPARADKLPVGKKP